MIIIYLKTMKNKILTKLIFILIISQIIICSKKNKKHKTEKPKKSIDELASILNWAKDNKIYINENLVLNKNKDTDPSHNFFYFTPSETIPNDTVLLRVNYDSMISQSILENLYKESKNKKFADLWDRIIEIDNYYITYFSTKQLFYMSILVENAMNKKKGPLYKRYGPFLDMYEYINLDNYPVFFDYNEISFLSMSNFGYQLTRAMKSLDEEYYILKNTLNITSTIQDDFKKYRVLVLSNSVSLNNTNLKDRNNFNETIVVPFIDCFNKIVSIEKANAHFSFKKNNNNSYYLEVISTKEIPKGGNINLQWKKLPNSDCLLYYGFIEEGNALLPKYHIDMFNRLFKKKMGIPMNTSYANIMSKSMYELSGNEIFSPDVVDSYKNLSQLFDKYKNKDVGYYEMMVDNLNFYLKIYKEQYTDGNINLYVSGNDKAKYLKEIIRMEERMVELKIRKLQVLIDETKKHKDAHTQTDL